MLSVNERIGRMKNTRTGITVTEWIDKYLQVQQDRFEHGELKPHSLKQKNKPLRLFREHCGMQYIKDITAVDIAEIIVVSKYLVHFRHATSQAPRGGQISTRTLTPAFKKTRDKSGLKWDTGTEPTFHEQRSLSERLYRDQGIDTQKLLGHRTSKMTDKYNDDRGKDWVIIGNKTA